MKWKIASVVYGIFAFGLSLYKIIHYDVLDWEAVIPLLAIEALTVFMMWMMGKGVWITDKEYEEYEKSQYIVSHIVQAEMDDQFKVDTIVSELVGQAEVYTHREDRRQ